MRLFSGRILHLQYSLKGKQLECKTSKTPPTLTPDFDRYLYFQQRGEREVTGNLKVFINVSTVYLEQGVGFMYLRA